MVVLGMETPMPVVLTGEGYESAEFGGDGGWIGVTKILWEI